MKNKFLATLFLACSISTVSAQTPVYMDDAQPIEARVKDALSRMTLEEKVALCHELDSNQHLWATSGKEP